MQMGVKFEIKQLHEVEAKDQKFWVNWGLKWVLLMGKTVGKKFGTTVPLTIDIYGLGDFLGFTIDVFRDADHKRWTCLKRNLSPILVNIFLRFLRDCVTCLELP